MEAKKTPLAKCLLRRRMPILIVGHLVIFAMAYLFAFALRFDFDINEHYWALFFRTLPWLLVAKMLVVWRFGNIHGWWRHVTFADLADLLRVGVLSTLVVAAIDYFVVPQYQIPRAVLLLDLGATLLLVGGLRSTWRLYKEEVWQSFRKRNKIPALIIANSQDCETLARQIHGNPNLAYRIIGFLDQDSSHFGSRLGGIPFLGSPSDAVRIAVGKDVDDILVIAGSVPGRQLRSLITQCNAGGIQVHMIPPLCEVLKGTYRWRVRDVDIRDLLHRDPIELDPAPIREMINGRRVLVTGAGGSIGSEICRQVAACEPKSLILVERAENSLFLIEQNLQDARTEIIPLAADIRDRRRMRSIFEQHAPEIVFHAAAHKHVPLMEVNAGEAINNNVFGTCGMADLADEYSVERFVLISTDKAVNPTSVMGVTKLLAERYVHAFATMSDTKFVVVRFGNVLASNGSVVPIFQEQIRTGGPVTVTHPEMKRFFMTIPEASELVMHASAMGAGGEIFILDMGEQIKIVDVAEDLIRLSGPTANDVQIAFSGVRPGEKLFEELHGEDEELVVTSNPKLRIAYGRPRSMSEVREQLDQIAPLVFSSNQAVHEGLLEVVHEYAESTALHTQDQSLQESCLGLRDGELLGQAAGSFTSSA